MAVSQAARDFASNRETSDEIAQAILDFAGGDHIVAEATWLCPSPEEYAEIVADAWALASEEEHELFWGGRIRRPQQTEA